MAVSKIHRMLLWQAITPLHVGTGNTGAEVVDMPVAREASTRFPMLPASSIKGVFRDGADDEDAKYRFGYADNKEQQQGALTFLDARLFALAVPSFRGTYALVTCPLVVRRLNRDRELLGLAKLPEPELGKKEALVTGDELVLRREGKLVVLIQDYALEAAENTTLLELANEITRKMTREDREIAIARHCMVSDQVFSFLCRMAMDITAHNRLDRDSKTVEKGALWWEECIPAESLLTSIIIADHEKAFEGIPTKAIQIGGKHTVGRGLVKIMDLSKRQSDSNV